MWVILRGDLGGFVDRDRVCPTAQCDLESSLHSAAERAKPRGSLSSAF